MADPGNKYRCVEVEEVELSLISDDPVRARSAEIPLEYHTDPSRPFTSSQLRDEDSELPEQADELVATSSSEDTDRSAFEKKLNGILDEGNFHAIKQNVTPKTLSRCQTNTLLKAFQVTEKLRDLAHEENPEKDDIEKLEKSLNEFTSTLIDPLKAKKLRDLAHEGNPEEDDISLKDVFHEMLLSSCFDHVIDKAIDTKQKKFIAHPAVYNLLNSTWYRSFSPVRTESWQKPGRWGYFFLNLWTVFDFVLFPLLFAIFFAAHLFKQVLRKRRDIEEKDDDIYDEDGLILVARFP